MHKFQTMNPCDNLICWPTTFTCYPYALTFAEVFNHACRHMHIYRSPRGNSLSCHCFSQPTNKQTETCTHTHTSQTTSIDSSSHSHTKRFFFFYSSHSHWIKTSTGFLMSWKRLKDSQMLQLGSCELDQQQILDSGAVILGVRWLSG